MSDNLPTALDSVKNALGGFLIDFKKWSMPGTKAFKYWKRLAPNEAIKVVPSRMIDDVDSMLAKYRQQVTTKGFVAPLPVMFIALAPMVSPPDVSNLRGVPYWLDTMVPTDPENRKIRLRTIPTQYRVQIAFVGPEGDTSQAVINQFCAYMTDDSKRRFMATYELGGGVKDDWELTVIENSLFPDSVPTGQNNLWVNTVDFQVIGLAPQVVGLDPDDYDVDQDGRPPVLEPGTPETPEENPGEWDVVREADLHSIVKEPTIMRAVANEETLQHSIKRVPDHE
jgi:hypothetical protein